MRQYRSNFYLGFETLNYRCEYLQYLEKTYVKTQDEVVDIDVRSFTLIKPSNYLKRIKEKPFGYVTSYDCKVAKEAINYWKRKIILKKRARFREKVGAESFADKYSKNSEKDLKYLSHVKAYKTLLSFSSDEQSETIISDESELHGDQYSTTFAEENESILSHEDSSFLSDTVRIASVKQQDKVITGNENFECLATKDEKHSAEASSVQELQNFKLKNCTVNILKFDTSEQVKLLIGKLSPLTNNKCYGKAPKIIDQNINEHLKSISSAKKNQESGSVFSICHAKPFIDYFSSKSTSKFKFRDIGMRLSNKNFKSSELPKLNFDSCDVEIFNKNRSSSCGCDTKSLSYISNKSAEASRLIHKENKNAILDKNLQNSHGCNTYISNKSIDVPKLRFRDDEKITFNKNCQISSGSDKPLPVSSKSIEASKLRLREDEILNNQISSYSNDKSLSYSLKKSNEAPRLKPKDNRTTFDKNLTSNDSNNKSSICVSSKCPDVSKLKLSRDKKITFDKSCRVSNVGAKSLSYASNKHIEAPKLRYKEDEIAIVYDSNQATSASNAKPLSYVSNRSTESMQLRPRENKMTLSNKSLQASSNGNSKSSFYVSNESADDLKLRFKKGKSTTSNKNNQVPNRNAKSLSCVSDKLETSKLRELLNRKDEIETSNNQASSHSNGKSSSYASKKSTETLRLRPKEDRIATSIYHKAKSLSHTSNKSFEAPKVKSEKDGMVISSENCFSDSNTKSLLSASNKSSGLSKLRLSKIVMETPDKHSKAFSDCIDESLSDVSKKSTKKEICTKTPSKSHLTNSFPFSTFSFSSSLNSNLEVSLDPLSISGRQDVASCKKKPRKNLKIDSLAQSRLSRSCKKFYENGIEIDDIKKVSTPQNSNEKQQKDCEK